MDQLFSQLQTVLAGRFSLERELGRGGMGVVFLARDVALDRPVAIKLLPPTLATDATQRERFLREARTAAQLSHPNIVPIHLVEERDDLVYFVMAFVEGESLGERVRRAGPLPHAEAVRVIREVAWALGYAHGRGVVHRDVKPDNILLEHGSGRAMVTDFGIARVASRGTVSQQDEILGTVQYMAPEQADPAATLDGRADLYALGATAFYAATGRLPFEAPSALALIAMHLTEPAPPVASVRADLPPRFAEAVDRCLAKDRATRFATAEALATALGEVAGVKPVAPSVIAVRDAANAAFVPVSLGTTAWLVATSAFPAQAATLGWFTAGIAGIGTLQVLRAVRQALRDGLSQHDVVEGITALTPISAGALELSRQQLGLVDRAARRPLVRLAVAVAGAFYVWLGASGILKVVLEGGPGGVRRHVYALLAGLMFTGLGVFVLGLAAGKIRSVGILSPPERQEARRSRLIRLIWGTAPMRLFFRIAGLGIGRPKETPATAPMATELLLGAAAGSLFEALPKAQRVRLEEVPDVIKALERAATTLRARRDQLEQAVAEAGVAQGTRGAAVVRELVAARDAATARLQAAVTALENLRLDLLRLRAGVGGADELTGSLEEARRIGEIVEAELEGRREADRLAPG